MAGIRDYWTEVLADSPTAYWRLNELTGTTAVDLTGNGRTGTIVGGVELGHVGALSPAGLGRAVSVDGIDGGVTVADHADLDADTSAPSTGHFSVEAWVYPTSATETTRYIVHKQSGAGAGWYLYTYGTGCYLYLVDADTDTAYSTGTTLTLNAWNHLVGVIDRTAQRCLLYRNGVVTGAGGDTTAVGNLANAVNLGIGRTAAIASGPFLGRIAEVAIYQSALSSARIAAHYAAAKRSPSAVLACRFGPARFGATRFGYPGSHTARCFINAVDRTTDIVAGSLSVNDQTNDAPTTASITVRNTAPTEGHSIWVVENDTYHGRRFGGVVQQVEQEPLAGGGTAVQWRVTATDGLHLLDRRRISKTYGSQAADIIVRDIITNYTSGFTSQHVTYGLDSVAMTFTAETVSGALTRLANAIGGYWYLDPWLDVHFVVSDSQPAPADVVEAGLYHPRDLRYARDLSQIKTRVTVRGMGFTLSQLWGYSSITAAYIEQYNLSSFFSAGDKITIGTGTSPIRVVSVFSSDTTILGNYLQLNATDAAAAQTELGGYSAAQQIGTPVYICAQENDATAQTALAALEGGDGIHEHYILDGRYTYGTAQARALAELELYAYPTERLTYTTYDPHAYAGRPVRVKLNAPWNVDTTMTIQSVMISNWTPNPKALPLRRVTAASANEADLYTVLRRIQEQRGT